MKNYWWISILIAAIVSFLIAIGTIPPFLVFIPPLSIGFALFLQENEKGWDLEKSEEKAKLFLAQKLYGIKSKKKALNFINSQIHEMFSARHGEVGYKTKKGIIDEVVFFFKNGKQYLVKIDPYLKKVWLRQPLTFVAKKGFEAMPQLEREIELQPVYVYKKHPSEMKKKITVEHIEKSK